MTVNGLAKDILRPGDSQGGAAAFPLKPEQGPATYVIKAYEFLPGKGGLWGWTEADGTRVEGARGDLVFCITYTWEELRSMDFTITITRNVFPGFSPPGCEP